MPNLPSLLVCLLLLLCLSCQNDKTDKITHSEDLDLSFLDISLSAPTYLPLCDGEQDYLSIINKLRTDDNTVAVLQVSGSERSIHFYDRNTGEKRSVLGDEPDDPKIRRSDDFLLEEGTTRIELLENFQKRRMLIDYASEALLKEDSLAGKGPLNFIKVGDFYYIKDEFLEPATGGFYAASAQDENLTGPQLIKPNKYEKQLLKLPFLTYESFSRFNELPGEVVGFNYFDDNFYLFEDGSLKATFELELPANIWVSEQEINRIGAASFNDKIKVLNGIESALIYNQVVNLKDSIIAFFYGNNALYALVVDKSSKRINHKKISSYQQHSPLLDGMIGLSRLAGVSNDGAFIFKISTEEVVNHVEELLAAGQQPSKNLLAAYEKIDASCGHLLAFVDVVKNGG